MEHAIRCLGLFASLDREVAKQYIPILVLYAENASDLDTNIIYTKFLPKFLNFKARYLNTQKIGQTAAKVQKVSIQAIGDLALIYESAITEDMSIAHISQSMTGDVENSSLCSISKPGIRNLNSFLDVI